DELNEKGHTIIVITHNMRLVAEHAKRTIVMHQGKIILDGPTNEVFSNTELLNVSYLRPPQITRLAQSLSRYGFPHDILTVDEMYQAWKNLASP
ncbi:MAG: ABC transporter ATP-binding protein, partial [Candidatus Bathyarchaeia archaeon]